MRIFPECPVKIGSGDTYYCRLLTATREGSEEEICSICADLQGRLRDIPELERTFDYVAFAHRNQVRKGTKIPYLIHLVRTWYYVQQMTEDLEEWKAALLHDTLEDTDVTEDELRREFGDSVAELVLGESEEKRADQPASETWELRKLETIRYMYDCIGRVDKIPSMHVAFGDKLANIFSMAFEYRVVGDRLWEKFNQKKKEMHGWYYGEMGYVFETIFGFDYPDLVKEYWEYYEGIFGKYVYDESCVFNKSYVQDKRQV